MAVAAGRPRSDTLRLDESLGLDESSGDSRESTFRQARIGRLLQDWGGVAAYVAVLTLWVVAKGIPLTRGAVALWLLAAMLAFSLRDLRHWVTSVALEWFPFIAFLFAYDTARSFAHRLFPTNVRLPLEGDRLLFGGADPTVWLQRHLWHGAAHVQWYDYAFWGVYMTFFFATLAVAAALWIFAYHRFRRYVAMVGLLSLMGLITYVLFPAAPPWYASEHGMLPPLQRLTGVVWSHSFVSISQVVDHGQGLSNPVAAMPSLHAAFTLLVALFLWRSARWWWRIPLALYPLAMGFTLMYFGEHYAVDVLAGWVYAILAYGAVEWFCARKAERSSSATAPSAAPARLVPAMTAAKRPD